MVAPVQTQRLHSAILDDFPDDGLRYEILDGELYVSATPSKRHHRLSKRLLRLIDGRYVEHARSLVLPGLTIDVPILMADLA